MIFSLRAGYFFIHNVCGRSRRAGEAKLRLHYLISCRLHIRLPGEAVELDQLFIEFVWRDEIRIRFFVETEIMDASFFEPDHDRTADDLVHPQRSARFLIKREIQT